MSGYFITIEGGEGTGKTTLIRGLKETLEKRGHAVVVTREPGGTPIADAIRRLLLDPASSGLSADAELLLYAASRAEHCDKVIRPALETGRIVICDRFCDATLAYQGYGRGLSLVWIRKLNDRATQGFSPQLTLLLDCPIELGLARAHARIAQGLQVDGAPMVAEDRFEQEHVDFHKRVRKGYLAIAKRCPDRVVVLDVSETPAGLLKQALDIVVAKIK